MSIRTLIANILFPLRCIRCKKEGTHLCLSCAMHCKKPHEAPHAYIHVAFSYKDPFIRKLIRKFKYSHLASIGKTFGMLLKDLCIEDFASWHELYPHIPLAIIPVPSSGTHTRSRGYNPSALIAKHMMDSVDIPHTIYMYAITKNPLIEAQSMINNRSKRLQNIKGAFILTDPQVIKGKYVVIVDDVTTTGGTIDEIKKLCMKAGAKKVSAYVVAH